MGASAKICGVIFSDLGQASSFMALDWVQEALKKSLGFTPFPATLNVRPKREQDARVWAGIQADWPGIPLPPADGGFCSARLYRVEVEGWSNLGNQKSAGAVLLPSVSGYPKDKIEIVAPVRLKSVLGVEDGDQLTLEFSLE
jgi:riboflavin kinase, archaea type